MAPFFRDSIDIFAVVEGAVDGGVDAEGVNFVSFTVGMVTDDEGAENCGGNGPVCTSCLGAAFNSGESENEDARAGCC